MSKKKAVPENNATGVTCNNTAIEETIAYLNCLGRRFKNFEEMQNACVHFGYKGGFWNFQAYFIMLRAEGNNLMPDTKPNN